MSLRSLEVRQKRISLVGDRKVIKRERKELCDEGEWAMGVSGERVNVWATFFLAPFLRKD